MLSVFEDMLEVCWVTIVEECLRDTVVMVEERNAKSGRDEVPDIKKEIEHPSFLPLVAAHLTFACSVVMSTPCSFPHLTMGLASGLDGHCL